MTISFIILAPLLLACAVIYVRFQPKGGSNIAKNKFNILVAVLAILASIAISTYFWQTTGKSIDSAWWPVLAIFGSMFLISLILLVGVFIRYFIFNENE